MMTVHLKTQSDIDEAVNALVTKDPRLKPILERTGLPALRQRQSGYEGLAAIVCGQKLSTASAAAIWGRLSTAFEPFHHDAIRQARARCNHDHLAGRLRWPADPRRDGQDCRPRHRPLGGSR